VLAPTARKWVPFLDWKNRPKLFFSNGAPLSKPATQKVSANPLGRHRRTLFCGAGGKID